jgi:hypothetical protein
MYPESNFRHHSGSPSAEPQAQYPRRRWLKFALAAFLAMLVVGGALAGTTGSDSKAALQKAQTFNKIRTGMQGSPDFQFIGQGQIVGGAGMDWLISGVPIELDEHTQIVGDLGAGDFVVLSGRILSNGDWLADHIERSDGKDTYFTFNGPLAAMAQGTWKVGGRLLMVDERTELESDLALNDPVLATFTLLEDGSWLALKVEYFDEPWIEPTPTPTATLAPVKKPAPAVITAPKKNDKPAAKPRSAGDDDDDRDHDHHDDDDHEDDDD